jgi:hypothetical protein
MNGAIPPLPMSAFFLCIGSTLRLPLHKTNYAANIIVPFYVKDTLQQTLSVFLKISAHFSYIDTGREEILKPTSTAIMHS